MVLTYANSTSRIVIEKTTNPFAFETVLPPRLRFEAAIEIDAVKPEKSSADVRSDTDSLTTVND
jgi:hypothetical protein